MCVDVFSAFKCTPQHKDNDGSKTSSLGDHKFTFWYTRQCPDAIRGTDLEAVKHYAPHQIHRHYDTLTNNTGILCPWCRDSCAPARAYSEPPAQSSAAMENERERREEVEQELEDKRQLAPAEEKALEQQGKVTEGEYMRKTRKLNSGRKREVDKDRAELENQDERELESGLQHRSFGQLRLVRGEKDRRHRESARVRMRAFNSRRVNTF